MPENLFNPRTRQTDERQITRVQTSFEEGVYKDIPASDVPDHGLVELKDMINYGTYLGSRPGSKLWGSLPNTDQQNSWFFHEKTRRLFIHQGDAVFQTEITGVSVGTWTELNKVGTDGVSAYHSHMTEYKNDILLYCSNGIFRIKASVQVPTYMKINCEIPTSLVSGAGSDAGAYEYRYNYALSVLTGDGVRNRQTKGVKIDVETGTTEFNLNSSRDYGAVYSASGISSGNLVTSSGYVLSQSRLDDSYNYPFTHFSVYRTKNLGVDGVHPQTNAPNEKDLYIWVEDMLINKSFLVTSSGTVVTATRGEFSAYDIGNNLWVSGASGSVSGEILSLNSATSVNVGTTFNVTSVPATIGNATYFSGSLNGTALTSSTISVFASGDIGKTIQLSNGVGVLVTGYSSPSGVTVDTSDSIAQIEGAFGCTDRVFTDNVTDNTLLDRERDYTLKQRFWTNLPPADVGEVFAGHMFVAQRNRSELFYSQLVDERLMGYYNAAYQTEIFGDVIKHISIFPDFLIVYCSNSIYSVPINYFTERVIETVGEVVSILAGTILLDNDHGVLDYGSIKKIGSGLELFIANDYSMRVFNGKEVSDNLLEKRFMNDMKKMNAAFSSSYTRSEGYNLWGKQ